MTPDLSYTTRREGESSARIINGMGKKLIKHENSVSDKLHQQVITADYSGGIPIQVHSVTSRSRRSLLYLLWAIYGCQYAGTWRFDGSCVPNSFIFDALGTNCIDSS